MRQSTYKTKSTIDRFNASFVVEINTGCHIWTKAVKHPSGYGRFKVNGMQLTAHRWIWEYYHGTPPDGMCVTHTCKNPRCVNIEHLALKSQSELNLESAKRSSTERNASKSAKETYRKLRFQKPVATSWKPSGSTRLDESKVREILARIGKGDYVLDIAVSCDISPSHVYNIAAKRNWRHVSAQKKTPE